MDLTKLKDDGDVFRALGYVSLYDTYLKETIDLCFDQLLAFKYNAKFLNINSYKEKLNFCISVLNDLYKKFAEDTSEMGKKLSVVLIHLGTCENLLSWTHTLLTNRRYDDQLDLQHKQVKAGEKRIKDISSKELYVQANLIAGFLINLSYAYADIIPMAIELDGLVESYLSKEHKEALLEL